MAAIGPICDVLVRIYQTCAPHVADLLQRAM